MCVYSIHIIFQCGTTVEKHAGRWIGFKSVVVGGGGIGELAPKNASSRYECV